MVTERAFLRFMFTAAPVLCILHMVQGEHILALYGLAIAPLAFLVAPYVCDDKR